MIKYILYYYYKKKQMEQQKKLPKINNMIHRKHQVESSQQTVNIKEDDNTCPSAKTERSHPNSEKRQKIRTSPFNIDPSGSAGQSNIQPLIHKPTSGVAPMTSKEDGNVELPQAVDENNNNGVDPTTSKLDFEANKPLESFLSISSEDGSIELPQAFDENNNNGSYPDLEEWKKIRTSQLHIDSTDSVDPSSSQPLIHKSTSGKAPLTFNLNVNVSEPPGNLRLQQENYDDDDIEDDDDIYNDRPLTTAERIVGKEIPHTQELELIKPTAIGYVGDNFKSRPTYILYENDPNPKEIPSSSTIDAFDSVDQNGSQTLSNNQTNDNIPTEGNEHIIVSDKLKAKEPTPEIPKIIDDVGDNSKSTQTYCLQDKQYKTRSTQTKGKVSKQKVKPGLPQLAEKHLLKNQQMPISRDYSLAVTIELPVKGKTNYNKMTRSEKRSLMRCKAITGIILDINTILESIVAIYVMFLVDKDVYEPETEYEKAAWLILKQLVTCLESEKSIGLSSEHITQSVTAITNENRNRINKFLEKFPTYDKECTNIVQLVKDDLLISAFSSWDKEQTIETAIELVAAIINFLSINQNTFSLSNLTTILQTSKHRNYENIKPIIELLRIIVKIRNEISHNLSKSIKEMTTLLTTVYNAAKKAFGFFQKWSPPCDSARQAYKQDLYNLGENIALVDDEKLLDCNACEGDDECSQQEQSASTETLISLDKEGTTEEELSPAA